MKKNKISLLAALVLSTCTIGLASCGGDSSSNTSPTSSAKTSSSMQSETTSSTSNTSSSSSSTVVEDVYALTTTGETTRSLEEGDSDTIEYTVTKNGEELTGTTLYNIVQANVEGAAVTFNTRTKIVSASQPGTATITISLLDHEEVTPIVITYTVTASFWSSTLSRGTVVKNGNSASFTKAGEQPMIAVKEASTNFVFKGTVSVTAYTGTQSFGIGSFYDAGDTALWFGLRNDDNIADTTYSVYIRNFYKGWGSATTDGTPTGYDDIDFGTNTFKFEIIRIGNKYRYSINGIFGTYTNNTDVTAASYPGFYIQEKTMDITNCEYITDATQVQAAYDAYASKEAFNFVLNDSAMSMVRGTTHQFTYASYPSDAVCNITWSLDTKQMTAGVDGTSISTVGLLTLADDAAGIVTVKATNGTITREVPITILEKSPDKENELLSVKGGVILDDDDGSITFPRNSEAIDGVVNENAYADATYTANLKEKAIGNFSVKFKVSNYHTTETYPKLMVSLGGTYEQFYIVYKTDGTCRIETYTRGLRSDGSIMSNTGNWNNSANFTDFDASKEHTFEIRVVDGKYEVYLDDGETPLSFNMNGESVELVRGVADIATETPVRFSTKGVSAKVSNITFTNGSSSDIQDWYKYNTNTSVDEKNNVTVRFGTYSWTGADNYYNYITSSQVLPENFEIDFNLLFSNEMNDAKFVVELNNGVKIMINNKYTGSNKMSINVYGVEGWNEDSMTEKKLSYAIRIIRKGNNLQIYADEQKVKDLTNDAILGGTTFGFWAFNSNGDEADYTATASNISLSELTETSES